MQTFPLKKHAYGWSKMVCSVLELESPVVKQNSKGKPMIIIARSYDDSIAMEMRIANFAMRVIMHEKNAGIYKEINHKTYKNIRCFHDFSKSLVLSYCLAYGFVSSYRVNNILRPEDIKELENRGWAMGIFC